MTISKKTMKEVLESDKQIIERLTKENAELKEKQNKMEQYMDSLEINDNFDGLLDFLKILYENKDEFMDFLNIKKNNLEKKTKSLNIYNN
jgi:peptidoglycan hydrolase CwlO-like protein